MYFMCVVVLPVCISVYRVHAVPTEAKRGSYISLELELQMVVGYHVGPGNQTLVV